MVKFKQKTTSNCFRNSIWQTFRSSIRDNRAEINATAVSIHISHIMVGNYGT